MVIAHGFLSRLGVGLETVLGTPVAATQLVCFNEESLSEVRQEVIDASLCGSPTQGLGQPGTRIVEGGFSYPMRTGLGDLVLSRFFGLLSADTPGAGQNTFELQGSIDGLGLTVAIDKQNEVWEYAGFKTSSLTIDGSPGDGIVVTVDGFARSLSLVSVLNTPTVLGALPQQGNILLFQDAVFRIADLVDALQASDAVSVSQFSIELNRNLEPIEVNSSLRTEAIENAFRESTFTFTIPQYQSAFFVNAHRNYTQLQADIVVTVGAVVRQIRMPRMVVTGYTANVGGPEFITHEVTCRLIADPEGANAFMTLQEPTSELEIIEEN